MLLLDAISQVELFVSVFATVYALALVLYVLLSWIRLPPSLGPLQRFLYDVCEPYLRLFRRILPPLGPLDLSPMIGIVVLLILGQIVNRILASFH
jgi:YggT family protein